MRGHSRGDDLQGNLDRCPARNRKIECVHALCDDPLYSSNLRKNGDEYYTGAKLVCFSAPKCPSYPSLGSRVPSPLHRRSKRYRRRHVRDRERHRRGRRGSRRRRRRRGRPLGHRGSRRRRCRRARGTHRPRKPLPGRGREAVEKRCTRRREVPQHHLQALHTVLEGLAHLGGSTSQSKEHVSFTNASVCQ
jgi:hypothetical protein